jgi:signal transduction histidine kinase/CheY-like chemotaxis protein
MTASSHPDPATERTALRASLDSMLDGFASFRAVREDGAIVDFEWTYTNPAADAAYPFEHSVIGERLLELRPSVKTSGLFDRLVAVVESGEPMDLLRHEYVAGDEPRTVEMRAWRDGDGVSATWRDVTEREQSAAALASSENRFRVSVESLNEALLVFRPERDSAGAVVDFVCTYANAAAARNARTPLDQLIGGRMLTVFPAHNENGMFDNYVAVVESGTPYTNSTLWYEGTVGPQGEPVRRAFEVSASKIDDGIVVVARDVTKEREHEAELARQRVELERAYEAALAENERAHARAEAHRRELEARLQQSQRLEGIGQLAGGIAHDFNNLLAAILNYSSFVQEELEAEVAVAGNDRWQPALDDIRQVTRATERAAQLTRQLLAFARREIARPCAMDLNEVVTGMMPLLSRTIGEDMQLVTALEEDLSPVVADPAQLEQVLLNLAINARDAMSNGGTITIETKNDGESVRLMIRDTGTGMPPEVVARAFEPFFTTKDVGVGTGLGLAMTYGIITEAGGTIALESEVGVGTAVIATFPAARDVRPDRVEADDTASPKGRGETVLLVEDDDAMRDVTSRMLMRNGYSVVMASNGAQAVDLATNFAGTIDVLLTDVVMPAMNGRETAELVLAIRPECRVVYMSGYARPALAGKGTLEAGINLLPKPFTERLLLCELARVLQQSESLPT